jgi:hypothetical protein
MDTKTHAELTAVLFEPLKANQLPTRTPEVVGAVIAASTVAPAQLLLAVLSCPVVAFVE